MKKVEFKSYEDFKKEIENLKKKHDYFFADVEKQTIYTHTKKRNENFLSFYLDVLIMITEHWENELTSYTTTSWYFYISKSYIIYSKKDLEIMINKLGNNFNAYEGKITDKVGIFY